MEKDSKERLKDRAAELSELGQYREAVNLLRKVTSSANPEVWDLYSLRKAHESEQLAFLKELRSRYSQSRAVLYAYVDAAVRGGFGDVAFEACSSAIDAPGAAFDPGIRRLRLRAGRKSHRYEVWADDFVTLWKSAPQCSGGDEFARTKLKSALVREVAAIVDWEAAPALQTILADLTIPPGLKKVIGHKLSELGFIRGEGDN